MNPPNVASTPSAGVSLTRQEKEKLLRKMYSSSHWIALIRLFGYRRVPMDQAREEIGPVAKEFGQELVASACEALVEIKTENERQVAYLKPHVLRMAFQILGPERQPDCRVAPKAGRPPRT